MSLLSLVWFLPDVGFLGCELEDDCCRKFVAREGRVSRRFTRKLSCYTRTVIGGVWTIVFSTTRTKPPDDLRMTFSRTQGHEVCVLIRILSSGCHW